MADAVLRELALHAAPVTAETVRTAVIYHTPDADADVDDAATPPPRAEPLAHAPASFAAAAMPAADDDTDPPPQPAQDIPRTRATAAPAASPSRRDQAAALSQAQAQLRIVRRVAGDRMRLGQQIATSDAAVADDLADALDDVQAQLDVVRAVLSGDTAA